MQRMVSMPQQTDPLQENLQLEKALKINLKKLALKKKKSQTQKRILNLRFIIMVLLLALKKPLKL